MMKRTSAHPKGAAKRAELERADKLDLPDSRKAALGLTGAMGHECCPGATHATGATGVVNPDHVPGASGPAEREVAYPVRLSDGTDISRMTVEQIAVKQRKLSPMFPSMEEARKRQQERLGKLVFTCFYIAFALAVIAGLGMLTRALVLS